MDALDHYRAMARYNTWMNEKLYAVAATLSDEERKRDLGAFFRSVHGTLDHLVLTDRAWLWRFTRDPEIAESRDASGRPIRIASLSQELYADFDQLRRERARTDAAIETWTDGLDQARLQAPIAYKTSAGVPHEHPLWMALSHFFNHQTHHRGQVTTLLRQLGREPGVTDLIVHLRGG